MPDTNIPHKRNVGGPDTHKNPNCPCNACKARRRKASAQPLAIGARGSALIVDSTGKRVKVLNADLPAILQSSRSPRDRVLQYMHFRHTDPHLKNAEIAKRIGLTTASLTTVL